MSESCPHCNRTLRTCQGTMRLSNGIDDYVCTSCYYEIGTYGGDGQVPPTRECSNPSLLCPDDCQGTVAQKRERFQEEERNRKRFWGGSE